MIKSWGLAAGMLALVLLAGCASPHRPGAEPPHPSAASSTPTQPPTATSTPESTASPAVSSSVVDAPVPRTPIDCDDSLPVDVVASVLGPDVAPLDVATDVGFGSPLHAAPAGRGALLCSWGSEVRSPWWIAQPGFAGAFLTITPVTDDEWERYGTTWSYDNGDAMHTWCWPIREVTVSSCYFEGRVNGYFVEFRSSRLAGGANLTQEELLGLIQPVIDGITASLEADVGPAEQWTPAEPSLALPTECTGFLTTEQAESLTGQSPLSVARWWDGPSRGTAWIVSLFTGESRKCDFGHSDQDSVIGSVHAMVNGAWAGAERMDAHLLLGDATVAEVPGLADAERATLRCGDPEDQCVVDFTIDGNWIQVSVGWVPEDGDDDGPDTLLARQNILAIAGSVVENLTS